MKRFRSFFFEADAGGATGSTGAATTTTGAATSGGGTLFAGGASAQTTTGTTATTAATAQTGSSQQQPTGFLKDDGTFSDGWLDRLPGDLKGNAALKVMPSLEALAKSYVETKGMVGKKLSMPGEGATPEDMAAWRKVVGAPEKPEGYKPDGKSIRPESIPEALWDVKGEGKFLELAHKHSLPPAAVKDILAYYGESVATSLQQSQVDQGATLKAEGDKLRQTWGKDFDANLSKAQRVAQTIGLDPNSHPIFTSAEVVTAFAKMANLLSEDKLVAGGTQSIASSIATRATEITDPKGTSQLSREYRGEFGPERQKAAQEQLHQLYAAGAQK